MNITPGITRSDKLHIPNLTRWDEHHSLVLKGRMNITTRLHEHQYLVWSSKECFRDIRVDILRLGMFRENCAVSHCLYDGAQTFLDCTRGLKNTLLDCNQCVILSTYNLYSKARSLYYVLCTWGRDLYITV